MEGALVIVVAGVELAIDRLLVIRWRVRNPGVLRRLRHGNRC